MPDLGLSYSIGCTVVAFLLWRELAKARAKLRHAVEVLDEVKRELDLVRADMQAAADIADKLSR